MNSNLYNYYETIAEKRDKRQTNCNKRFLGVFQLRWVPWFTNSKSRPLKNKERWISKMAAIMGTLMPWTKDEMYHCRQWTHCYDFSVYFHIIVCGQSFKFTFDTICLLPHTIIQDGCQNGRWILKTAVFGWMRCIQVWFWCLYLIYSWYIIWLFDSFT